MGIDEILYPADPDQYGGTYGPDLVSVYEKYVESADKISDRRQAANAFFTSLHAALVTVLGLTRYIADSPDPRPRYFVPVLGCGILLSVVWAFLLRSYKNLNAAKFKVVHEMEKRLPVAPYTAEWQLVGRGKVRRRYWPFSHLEGFVPVAFAALYLVLLLLAVLQSV